LINQSIGRAGKRFRDIERLTDNSFILSFYFSVQIKIAKKNE